MATGDGCVHVHSGKEERMNRAEGRWWGRVEKGGIGQGMCNKWVRKPIMINVGIPRPWQGRHDLGPDQLDHSMVKTKTDYYNRPIGLYKHCTTGMTNSKITPLPKWTIPFFRHRPIHTWTAMFEFD